jgi:membrane protein implicated in regulation of membrane protease activity
MLLALVLVVLGGALALPAAAQDDTTALNGIDVVQVDGLLDPPNVALVESAVRAGAKNHSTVLVIQLAATGAVDANVDKLVDIVANATVPIGVWIGPSGADARGASALLALSAPIVSVAPGAGVGPAHPLRFDEPGDPPRAEVVRDLRAAQAANGRSIKRGRGGGPPAFVGHGCPSRRRELGPTHCRRLHRGARRPDGDGRGQAGEARHADVIGEGNGRRRQPNQEVGSTSSTSVSNSRTRWTRRGSYFLFVAGFALIISSSSPPVSASPDSWNGRGHRRVLRLAPPGAVVGDCVVAARPARLSIDLRPAGSAWTFIGAASLVAGSVTLYGGSSRSIRLGGSSRSCGGTVLFMLSGMTAVIRSRFSTPTIGREELIGEMGVAEVDVAPDGVVRIHDALWRAHEPRDPYYGRRRDPSGRRGRHRAGGRTARRRARSPSAPAARNSANSCRFWAARLSPSGGPDTFRRHRPGRGGTDMVALGIIHETWHLRAACRGPESVLFFPPTLGERRDERESREARAKAICAQCDVCDDCLDFALRVREPHGIWGGLTETERRRRLPRD